MRIGLIFGSVLQWRIIRRDQTYIRLSIAVEGGELDVLDGFSLDRFRPRVLIMENDRRAGVAIEPYLNERGYSKFHRQKINDFYVREDDGMDGIRLSALASTVA